MLKACACFNILVGSLAVHGGLNLAVLGMGFGAGLGEVMLFMGPLILGGLLCASSGVILWRSLPSISGKALVLQGLALVGGLAYCWIMFATMEFDPYDEEHRLFLVLPAVGLLLVGVQFAYLAVRRLHQNESQPDEGVTSDNSGPPKVKRRWYRFNKWTLLVIIVACFVAVVRIGSMIKRIFLTLVDGSW